jgi:restriction endonuclease S subunit
MEPEGKCLLVQAGNIDTDRGEVAGELMRIAEPPSVHDHVLRYGDVVMVGRGVRNAAAAFIKSDLQAVAAAHLMVLATEGKTGLPEFLTWFLNLPRTQARLRSLQSGSSVPFVPLEALESIEVPVPSLELQRKVVEIQKLRAQEGRLLGEIRSRRRVLVDATLREAVYRESGEPV